MYKKSIATYRHYNIFKRVNSDSDSGFKNATRKIHGIYKTDRKRAKTRVTQEPRLQVAALRIRERAIHVDEIHLHPQVFRNS